ncbi:MAG TPA: hypothetical protein VH370_13750 [Humisphaera sp.]|nr:hypothetical protein [Humisphaera sp.]
MGDPVDHSSGISLPAVFLALFGGIGFAALLAGGTNQLLAALYVSFLLVLLATVNPPVAIMASFVYLAVLGDSRRLVTVSMSASFDPMLLVGPLIAFVLATRAYLGGLVDRRTRTAKLLVALMAVMFVQIFNPLQGGIIVGIGGMLFYVVPVLWFWIGHAWGSQALLETVIFRVVVPVALMAAILGIYQAVYDYLPFERAWFARMLVYNVRISGSTWRPMGFFSSSSEYTRYVATAMMAPVAAILARRPRASLVVVPVLFVAIFFAGIRGPLVGAAMTLMVLWAVLGRSLKTSAVRMVVSGVVIFGGMIWTLNHLDPADISSSPQLTSLIQHQIDGVGHMEDEHKSSGIGHVKAIFGGIWWGLTTPWGHGLGSTNMAGARLGGDVADTEVDFSDAFLSMGLVGGVIYLLFMGSIIRTGYRLWQHTRRPMFLVVISFMAANITRWLYGGEYACCALVFFCFGCLNRAALENGIARLVPQTGQIGRPSRRRARRAATHQVVRERP